jgi:DNA-binding NtrC family response regulator
VTSTASPPGTWTTSARSSARPRWSFRPGHLCPDDTIEPEHFPIEPAGAAPQHAALRESAGALELELPEEGASLDAIERAAIEETLRRTRGNVSQAARMLGLSRGALRNKLTRHRINTRHFARRALVES